MALLLLSAGIFALNIHCSNHSATAPAQKPAAAPPAASEPKPAEGPAKTPAAEAMPQPSVAGGQDTASLVAAINEGRHQGIWEVQRAEYGDSVMHFQTDIVQVKITDTTMTLFKNYTGLALNYEREGQTLVVGNDEYRKFIDADAYSTAKLIYEVKALDDSNLELRHGKGSWGGGPFTLHLVRVDAAKELKVAISPSLADQQLENDQAERRALARPPDVIEGFDQMPAPHPKGGTFVPLVWHSTFTIWTKSFKTLSEIMNTPAVLLKTNRDERLGEEKIRLPIAFRSDASSYRVHFVRRAHVLADGSLLFVVVEGTNVGVPYRNSYVIHTDQDLNPDKNYGKSGFFGLESDRSRRGYRYIKNFRNAGSGVVATDWRCISEGQPDYGQCDCYDFKLNSRGQRDQTFGFKKKRSCDD